MEDFSLVTPGDLPDLTDFSTCFGFHLPGSMIPPSDCLLLLVLLIGRVRLTLPLRQIGFEAIPPLPNFAVNLTFSFLVSHFPPLLAFALALALALANGPSGTAGHSRYRLLGLIHLCFFHLLFPDSLFFFSPSPTCNIPFLHFFLLTNSARQMWYFTFFNILVPHYH